MPLFGLVALLHCGFKSPDTNNMANDRESVIDNLTMVDDYNLFGRAVIERVTQSAKKRLGKYGNDEINVTVEFTLKLGAEFGGLVCVWGDDGTPGCCVRLGVR